jgi:predicted phosphodiesterase
MSARITKKGEVARKWCEKHPDVADNTLARMMLAKHDALFINLSTARQVIRYHRGRYSTMKSTGYKCMEPIPSTVVDDRTRSDYRAPKTVANDRTDFVIAGAQRILRLSDIHFPIHDPAALDAALEYGKAHNPTIILLDGDIADLSEFSTHEASSLSNYVKEEMGMIADFFDGLRRMFPKARIIWKEGNHEARFLKYLLRKAPELLATDCFDLMSFVRFISGRQDATHRVEWVGGQRIIRSGKLALLHGHEFRGGGGVNPARWLYLRTGENAVCGHFHRTSEHSEPSLSGEQRGAWSTGCLCHLSPEYLRHNKWNHGFAWVDVLANGNFRLKNIRILDGEIY